MPPRIAVLTHEHDAGPDSLAWAAEDGLREELEDEIGRRAPAWEAAGREHGKRFVYLASRQKSL